MASKNIFRPTVSSEILWQGDAANVKSTIVEDKTWMIPFDANSENGNIIFKSGNQDYALDRSYNFPDAPSGQLDAVQNRRLKISESQLKKKYR